MASNKAVDSIAVASTSSSSKKAPGQKGSKDSRTKASHPPTSKMVNNAIKSLKELGGSSLQAIKKYVSTKYSVDVKKFSPFIKKYLKSAVTSGSLVQTKGKGASGSFKLVGTEKSGSKNQVKVSHIISAVKDDSKFAKKSGHGRRQSRRLAGLSAAAK